MDAYKLTPKQLELLQRVCLSNGGGINAGYSETAAHTRTVRQLERKGLVQGKLGQPSCAVHTKEGLALFRQLKANQQNA
jgi:DNA-binding MarR family transcriptional regulator